MSGNNNNLNKSNNNNILSWIFIIALMFIPPTAPLGFILLFIRLGILGKQSRKEKRANQNAINSNKTNVSKTNAKVNVGNITKTRNRLDKKTGRGISVLLLLVSLGFFAIGGLFSLMGIDNLVAGYSSWLSNLSFGAFWILSGLVTFLSRNNFAKRINRYKNYIAMIGSRAIVPIADFAQMAGKSPKVVRRDLQTMISNGYLDYGTYVDNDLDSLVLSADEAEKLRAELRSGEYVDNKQSIGIYAANLAELREASSFIKDEGAKEKVSKLIELTEKIFKTVEEDPGKQQQLKRFMSYYLPTTLKLVRSYATLEAQGVSGENIVSTKKSIDDVLSTLTTGFEQQLDQLFTSDAIDIAADISVLENLMQQDGLSGDKSGFQTAASGS